MKDLTRDKMQEKKSSGPVVETQDEDSYPSLKAVLPAMGAIYLAVFVIALDRTILSTAVPVISNEFNSFQDISWYESGFLLPLCMFQLSFGRVYTFYSAKWVLAVLITIFEIGSMVAALAQNSATVIIGRVITGIGGAGITSGALILISFLVPLQSRPKYAGGLGAVFGLSSAIGPILGGYLTAVSWRWCFWINVPIGAISIVVLAFLCPNRSPPSKPAESWLGKLNQLDPLGFVSIAPAVVCLLFALRWGGVKYPWDDARVIALFVLFGVLGIAFIAIQIWRKDEATIPPRIFLQRSIFVSSMAAVGIGSILVVYSLYLPIWFQAIQGKSPQSSGLSLLPFLLSQVLFVILGGIATSVFGYYTPLMIFGSAVAIIGSALITTWQVDAGPAQWIGYQVLTGVGFGLVLQQPGIAAQTVLPKDEVSIGITLITFMQFFGGTIFTTVGQTLLESKLMEGLQGVVHGLNSNALSSVGATSLIDQVPADKLSLVLDVYNDSLRSIWYLNLGLVCFVFLTSLGLEWKNVKATKKSESPHTEEAV